MRSFLMKSSLLLSLGSFGLAAYASNIDPNQSHLKATFTQFNVPVTGEFTQFSGTVNFDETEPGKTTANLSVVTSSYDLGDDMYNQEVAGKDWFDSANHPSAQFVLQSVQASGNQYQATGQLTLRGVTKSVQFPAKLQQTDKAYLFTGVAEIKRLDYGVGQGDWGDTALVNDEVQIDFKLVLPK